MMRRSAGPAGLMATNLQTHDTKKLMHVSGAGPFTSVRRTHAARRAAADRADLRQWSFLPNTIQIIRIPVNPGKYTLKLGGLGRDKQQTETFNDVNLTVDKRQKVIHMVRSVL